MKPAALVPALLLPLPAFVLLSACHPADTASAAGADPRDPTCTPLDPGLPLEGEVARGESRCYELRLEAGDFALVAAEQRSTHFPNNLLLRRIGPGGDTVARKTNRQLVPEVAAFVAPEAGTHRFEVTRLEHPQGPPTGPYAVRLEAVLSDSAWRAREEALAADPRVA